MQVTIIPSDGFISVDGYGLVGIDMEGVASDVHAVQFKNGYGEVEIEGGDNQSITSIEAYQQIIDRHAAAKYEIEQRAINPFHGMTNEQAVMTAAQAKGGQLREEFVTRMNQPVQYDGDVFLADEWTVQTLMATLLNGLAQGLSDSAPVITAAPLQDGYWYAADPDGVARRTVPMNFGRLKGLGAVTLQRNAELHGKVKIHEAQVEVMVAQGATAQQIMSYDHTQGWNDA